MSVLPRESRKNLEKACVQGRRAAEAACRAAIGGLELPADRPAAHLSVADRALRRGLRAKLRQLGADGDQLDLLVADCAYEQWHRLLFARFLSENDLLIHPQYRAPVTLAECEELAADLGEPDGWAVAGRFAAEILPGIFRLDDPCVRLRLAPEGRLALEQIVASVPAEIFAADDALGWVYQYWQKEKKDEVNNSERKIGGADLGPVTQLFTENYMVRFLLENSLGAWWASRHPESALLDTWEYLRFDDEGEPAAGTFDGWPTSVAEMTVMDPCCGSGHFLVEAFGMLWRMRVEEQGLAPVAAQDAVLRDNLFGLELDPRCVQIAMFAVALTAWKASDGWRELPVPNVACSGIPVKAPANEWTALAGGDQRLESALGRLHVLFQDADTLGSLLDPESAVEIRASRLGGQRSLESIEWADVAPLLRLALAEEGDDPATAVFGAEALGLVRAADYLSRTYSLVATNVPYLTRVHHRADLGAHLATAFPSASSDLATAFHMRCLALAGGANAVADVTPQNWLYLGWYKHLRRELLDRVSWALVARLGTAAFEAISGEVVNVSLSIFVVQTPTAGQHVCSLDVQAGRGANEKAALLRSSAPTFFPQRSIADNPDSRFMSEPARGGKLLGSVANSTQGICTGDYARFGRFFWEIERVGGNGWAQQQSTVAKTCAYGGREHVLFWEGGDGELKSAITQRLGQGREGAWIRGLEFVGKKGVMISQSGDLKASLFSGDLLDNNAAAIVPHDESILPALWAYCSSPEFNLRVREVDQSLKVTNLTLLKVPFDLEQWQEVAEQAGPLPEPRSDDPTQWLFTGHPAVAMEPLQVAVGRLVGYDWPEQVDADDLEELADDDGMYAFRGSVG